MLIPLDMLRPGERAEVVEVTGDAAWVCRLAEMGLQQGCQLTVLQPGTPCLLKVADCRLCLRGEETTQIMVMPVTA